MDVFMPELSRFWATTQTGSAHAEPAAREDASSESNARTQAELAKLCERVSAARFVA